MSVADAAQACASPLRATKWAIGDPNGETRDVTPAPAPTGLRQPDAIARLPLLPSSGQSWIPWNKSPASQWTKPPTRIMHTEGKRTVTVTANVGGQQPGRSHQRRHGAGQTDGFPPGYGVELRGAGRDQWCYSISMTIALVAGIVVMYFILVMQFSSFMAPVAAALSLPLSLIGVVLALVSTGHIKFNEFYRHYYAYGTGSENAILLLDSARSREKPVLIVWRH